MKHNVLRVALAAIMVSLASTADAQVVVKGDDAPAAYNPQSASLSSSISESLSISESPKVSDDSKPVGGFTVDWRFPKHYKDIKGFDIGAGFARDFYFTQFEIAKAGIKGAKCDFAFHVGLHQRFYLVDQLWFAPLVGIGLMYSGNYDKARFSVQVEPRAGFCLSSEVSIYIGYRFVKPCGEDTADFGDCGGVSLGLSFDY